MNEIEFCKWFVEKGTNKKMLTVAVIMSLLFTGCSSTDSSKQASPPEPESGLDFEVTPEMIDENPSGTAVADDGSTVEEGTATTFVYNIVKTAVGMAYVEGHEKDILDGTLGKGGVGAVGEDKNATEKKQLCTGVYLKTFKSYIKDDIYYSSCDRAICTVIRSSDTDTKFPVGDVYIQYAYMQDSDNWEEISADEIEPGDVIVRVVGETAIPGENHIMMYVGTGFDIIMADDSFDGYVFADNTYVVAGDYLKHGPRVEKFDVNSMDEKCHVFRAAEKEVEFIDDLD